MSDIGGFPELGTIFLCALGVFFAIDALLISTAISYHRAEEAKRAAAGQPGRGLALRALIWTLSLGVAALIGLRFAGRSGDLQIAFASLIMLAPGMGVSFATGRR